MGVAGIIIFIVTFLVFFILSLFDSDPNNNPAGSMRMFPSSWLAAAATVPNVLLSVAFHLNFFPIFKGMKAVSDKRMSRAVIAAMMFVVFSYLVVGITGYYYVGNGVSANFLESLQYDRISKPFFFIINFSFLISIFFAFCLMFFSCRDNFIAIVKIYLVKGDELVAPDEAIDNIQKISSYIEVEDRALRKRRAKLHFLLYTFFLFLVIVGVALAVDSIEAVFSLSGAICSSSVCVLLPCFFYFRLVAIKKPVRNWKYYGSIALFWAIGPYCIFSIVCLYINID